MSSSRGPRVSSACRRCRQRKVRCSGSHPCTSCADKQAECIFDGEGRKIIVSQKYLQQLRQAARSNTADPDKRSPGIEGEQSTAAAQPMNEIISDEPNDPTLHPDPSPPSVQSSSYITGPVIEPINPLATKEILYITDPNGKMRWLGESSTWALTRKILIMLKNQLDQPELPDIDTNEESRAYELSWGSYPDANTSPNIPSADYALYLLNGVKFHAGQLYHLYDEPMFMQHFHEFYQDGSQVANAHRIWYVQFIFLLALGKAMVVNPIKGTNKLPGSDLFSYGMSLLPDVSFLFTDALTSIEIFCTIAIFLQTADMRNAAYLYIGHATRMALVFGLHRKRPVHETSPELVDRCQNIWWTVYILDRTFSSTMGVPITIRDDDITTPKPDFSASRRTSALYVHVKLSALIAKVINRVYGAEGRLQVGFLPSVREVLGSIASIAGDLNGLFPLTGHGSGTGVSRVAAHLHLYYHQAILLTLYPLLLYLFETRLKEGSTPPTGRVLSEKTQALLKTCADSCSSMMRILLSLRQDNMIECSFPFDLERTFACSLVASLVSFILPELNTHQLLHPESMMILEEMIGQGSIPAAFRKSEIEHLSSLIHLWESRIHNGTEGHNRYRNYYMQGPSQTTPLVDMNIIPALGEPNLIDTLSQEQIFSLAEMVDIIPPEVDYGVPWMDSWLWEGPSNTQSS